MEIEEGQEREFVCIPRTIGVVGKSTLFATAGRLRITRQQNHMQRVFQLKVQESDKGCISRTMDYFAVKKAGKYSACIEATFSKKIRS